MMNQVIQSIREQESISGVIILPNEEGYEEARRGWNYMIDKKPALIIQPHGICTYIQ